MPDGFKMYQCMDCGCVGVKNIAEQKDAPKDSKVSRCNSCGAWQFDALPCHTCLLIGAYDVSLHNYKQYAFIKLNHSTSTEFYCLDELYIMRVGGIISARNGSHYGIPQGLGLHT
jgi:hypothetical protein